MIEHQTKEYDDIDGNRGIIQWNYELEPTDEDEVKEYLINNCNSCEYNEDTTVYLISNITEDLIDFDVVPSDYFTEKEWELIHEG